MPRWPEAEQEVVLAYRGPAVARTITLEATPALLDLHLNVDTTASIRFAIDELQSALRSTVIARLRARVSDVSFGVSRFSDFPVRPFGHDGTDGEADRPFVLLTPVTSDLGRVTRAVSRLDMPLDHGGDIPEAGGEALYQVATGRGYRVDNRWWIQPWEPIAAIGGGELGGVGFRPHALHLVLHVADSPSHHPAEYDLHALTGTRAIADAVVALNALAARVVSILPTPCEDDDCRERHPLYLPTRAELSALAIATGATIAARDRGCPTGIDQRELPSFDDTCPLVYDVRDDGSGLSQTISDAVLTLLDDVRFGEVHAEVGTDHLGFVREVRVEPLEQPSGVHAPAQADRVPAAAPDGIAETYLQVERRARLGFRVTLENDRIAPSDVPQRFRLALRVLGDGVLLQEHLLRVVVPAADGDSGGRPDGGS